ncbi:MAG TPA: hypothetical protein PKY01_06655 [Candidatus Hydrogenedentes bacterium]|nr:hypothetical protein [Candidatus Hydrogenedentota bacterium]
MGFAGDTAVARQPHLANLAFLEPVDLAATGAAAVMEVDLVVNKNLPVDPGMGVIPGGFLRIWVEEVGGLRTRVWPSRVHARAVYPTP